MHVTLDVREKVRFDFENPVFLQFEVDQLKDLEICQWWTSGGRNYLVHQFCEAIHASLKNLPVFHSQKDAEYWNIFRFEVNGQDTWVTVLYVASKLRTLVKCLDHVAQNKEDDRYLFIPTFYGIKKKTFFRIVYNFLKQGQSTTF